MAMKVLITGGAGFIGSHVADAFLAAGHQVVIVDDLSSGAKSNVPKGASFHLMNIRAPELIKVFQLEKPDICDHLAAQISVTVSARNPVLDAEINCLGMLNVLEACRQTGVKKVIFSSSGGAIYGDSPLDKVPETHTPDPVSPYAIHKQTGEGYLKFYTRQHGLAFTSLRYANVFGPRQDPNGEAGVVAIFINALLSGRKPTINAYPEDPEGMARDYVYVEDVARANLLAMDKGNGEAVNIGTSVPIRTAVLLKTICSIMGKPFEFTLAGPRPGDVKKSCLDNAKAAGVLGWKPSFDLEAGLRRTVEHFSRNR